MSNIWIKHPIWWYKYEDKGRNSFILYKQRSIGRSYEGAIFSFEHNSQMGDAFFPVLDELFWIMRMICTLSHDKSNQFYWKCS